MTDQDQQAVKPADEPVELGAPPPGKVNWDLLEQLAFRPHKHLNIADDFEAQLRETPSAWLGEVFQEARTVQHLLDLAGVPEGWHESAHIDARVYLLVAETVRLRERMARLSGWHSRASGPGGTFDTFCGECGHVWPCETRRWADGEDVDDKSRAGADDGRS